MIYMLVNVNGLVADGKNANGKSFWSNSNVTNIPIQYSKLASHVSSLHVHELSLVCTYHEAHSLLCAILGSVQTDIAGSLVDHFLLGCCPGCCIFLDLLPHQLQAGCQYTIHHNWDLLEWVGAFVKQIGKLLHMSQIFWYN